MADIHMIAIGKADVCIQTESLCHEEIFGRPLDLWEGRLVDMRGRTSMEQSEGIPRKNSKNVLTVRTELGGVSVRKTMRKREGK
eukprot:3979721-Pyramimonas_sp.AAC.1